MTYQHEQIYVAWDFVRSMWETNGKSHTARLLGYPNKACHGASTTPNEGLPNAPGEPGLAVNRSWTDPQSLGLVSHLREMELHPNKHVFCRLLPQNLSNHVLNAYGVPLLCVLEVLSWSFICFPPSGPSILSHVAQAVLPPHAPRRAMTLSSHQRATKW